MPYSGAFPSAFDAARGGDEDVDYLLSHFPGAVSIYDSELTLLAANEFHYELAGLPRDGFGPGVTYESIVRHIAACGGYGDSVDVEAVVADRMRAIRQPHWKFERVQRGRHIAGYAVTTPSGGVICCQQDVTEQKETEQRLRALTEELASARDMAQAANSAKSDFLAMMSHEMRTPLNGILGMAELLAATAADAGQKSHLDVIIKSGQALLGIINDVLDLSRIEAGRLDLESRAFNLRTLVEDVAILLASRADENDVDVVIRYAPGLPDLVVGDSARIRQVLVNLVGNAIKFTHSGHVLITVDGETRHGRAALKIAVEDTGIGVRSDRLEHIFERFEQADPSSTRRYGGAGLGLAICRLLIEAMGGEIGVDSVLGDGSTFWFTVTLPVSDDAQAATQDGEPDPLAGTRILIADDRAVMRTALREQLEAWGVETVTAKDGADALTLACQAHADGQPFDAALLDLKMPDMDGLALAARMRDTLGDGAPALLLLSPIASGRPADRAKYGIEACLLKPTRKSELRDRLVRTLTGRKTGATVEPKSDAGGRPLAPRLLLVGADDACRTVIGHILHDLNADLDLASDQSHALSAFAETKPDLVLVGLEAKSAAAGLRIAEAVRATELRLGRGRTPMIGLAAHSETPRRERCGVAGLDQTLSMPVTPENLREAVEFWLNEACEGPRGRAIAS